MRILIVGHGAREHALARRLKHDGHEVIACAARENTGLQHDCHRVVPVTDYCSADIAALARKLKIELLIAADEVALFDGVADSARKAGVPCIGHDREASFLLERDRHEIIALLEPGGYARAPDGELVMSRRDWDALQPPERFVVKPIQAGSVFFSATPSHPRADLFPAWVEPYRPGIDFSLHYLVNTTGESFLGMTLDYPFLNQKSMTLTGGMGSVVPGTSDNVTVSDALLRDCKEMTTRLFRAIQTKRGMNLRGFVSAQFRKVGRQAIFTELDCKPGNPEIVALLPTIAGDLGSVLLQAAKGKTPTVTLNGMASVAISMVPRSYPLRKIGQHIIPLSYLNNPAIHFGETRQDRSSIKSGRSRSLCVTGMGTTIMEACSKAMPLAIEIGQSTGLVYRPDIGHALDAPRAAERVRKSLAFLKEKGGKRFMLRLSPEAHSSLKMLIESGRFKNETEAINAAINLAAGKH